MAKERINIAIDGPAGAGKSTIAKIIAEKLGILHLDTGAMYRAMAYKALRLGLNPSDRINIPEMLKTTLVSVQNIDGVQHTYVDGEDVTGVIRTPEVSKGASDIGVVPEVRIVLAAAQKRFAEENNVIMDGRDIGSYVLADSKNKFYVTASADERAKRRLLEMQAKGECNISHEQMREDIINRDRVDSTREFAPLTCVADAVVIDTTNLTINEAVAEVLKHIK